MDIQSVVKELLDRQEAAIELFLAEQIEKSGLSLDEFAKTYILEFHPDRALQIAFETSMLDDNINMQISQVFRIRLRTVEESVSSMDPYTMEIMAEIAKLEEDQAKFPTDYKAERIKQLKARLNI